MRVGLHHRRRDAPPRGGEHHRAGHVAAGAENDVRPARGDDPAAEPHGLSCSRHRPHERGARPARQPGDPERVEREPRLRNEPGFDAIRRPGERHAYAARAQRLGDGERRQHVAGGPAGRDQALERALLHHRRRC